MAGFMITITSETKPLGETHGAAGLAAAQLHRRAQAAKSAGGQRGAELLAWAAVQAQPVADAADETVLLRALQAARRDAVSWFAERDAEVDEALVVGQRYPTVATRVASTPTEIADKKAPRQNGGDGSLSLRICDRLRRRFMGGISCSLCPPHWGFQGRRAQRPAPDC